MTEFSPRFRSGHVGLSASAAMPAWSVAVGRGLRGTCPVCGDARLFRSGLSVRAACDICGTALGDVPADDAPPYLVIFVAVHPAILVALTLVQHTDLGTGAVLAITLPFAVGLCLLLLRPMKGGLIAVLLKLGIHRNEETLASETPDCTVPIGRTNPRPASRRTARAIFPLRPTFAPPPREERDAP